MNPQFCEKDRILYRICSLVTMNKKAGAMIYRLLAYNIEYYMYFECDRCALLAYFTHLSIPNKCIDDCQSFIDYRL